MKLLRRGRALQDEGEAVLARRWNYRMRLAWIFFGGVGLVLAIGGGFVLGATDKDAIGAALLTVGLVSLLLSAPLFFWQNGLSVRIRHYESDGGRDR